MARLFSKEYHELSNTWYFKESVIELEKGDLRYFLTRNEAGAVILRFYASPNKRKPFPDNIDIVYDTDEKRILSVSCHICLNNKLNNEKTDSNNEKQCRHYLSVVDYGYRYLSTNLTENIKTAVYTKNLLSYNNFRQSEAVNGKIHIEGIFDSRTDKIRFYFSGYKGISLHPISLIAAGKTEKNDIQRQNIDEQMSALSDAEVSLLGQLQPVKCAHSIKGRSWTIYKTDFPVTFTSLHVLSLQGKLFIKETGEKLVFTDEKYNLSFLISKNKDNLLSSSDNHRTGQEAYLLKPSSGCFFSAVYTGNFTYLFLENRVYSVRLPFPEDIIRQIFTGGYPCSEHDLVYFATVVAKQLAIAECYLDFDDDIVLPKHYSNRPQVIFELTSGEGDLFHDTTGHITGRETDYVRICCYFDYGEEKLPLDGLILQSNLISIERAAGSLWFYIPDELYDEVSNFIGSLPPPDVDEIMREGYYLYYSEHKIDRLKQLFYENSSNDWVINLDEKLKKEFIYKVELKPVIRVEQSEEIDWFGYDIRYRIKDVTFTHDELKEFFSTRNKYLKLPDGKLVYFSNKDTYDKIDRQLEDYRSNRRKAAGKDRISHYNLSYLYALSRYDNRIKVLGNQHLDKMYADLLRRRLEKKSEVPLVLFNVMRSYQKTGYRWLKMLQEYKLAGVLADDMGLGKTLQTIAVLADYYENSSSGSSLGKKDSSSPPPSLVVCPKTLLFNWAAEIEKFHSNLTYMIYEGAKETRKELLEDINVQLIIVSYALVSSDIELFSKYHFGYIVLDEAQHIKNPQSLRSKGVKKLNSDYKLALTGTPLENNIRELWSIYDFLMPGYLQSYRKFKNLYEGKDNDVGEENKEQKLGVFPLKEMISPFMLRRRKNEVLLELPDKQEQMLYCRMSNQQEKLYLKIIAMVRSSILPSLSDNNSEHVPPQLYINVLAALTRLRQVCNHPGLIKKELKERQNVSGKLELILEIINEAVDSGRNILVFSQFSSMLKIIASELQVTGFQFEYMDGATRNRKERIDNFCNNDNVRLFLMTLKVGGLGLNLTKADTVILVDPWWNPMAEAQSVDRVHRIGQTKKVIVYKMITKGSVEEKILQLQQNKLKLFNNLIEKSRQTVKDITVEDIRKLFESDS